MSTRHGERWCLTLVLIEPEEEGAVREETAVEGVHDLRRAGTGHSSGQYRFTDIVREARILVFHAGSIV